MTKEYKENFLSGETNKKWIEPEKSVDFAVWLS